MNKLNRGFKLPKKFIQSIMFAKGTQRHEKFRLSIDQIRNRSYGF
jgi:hypothetical protein